jgi:[ribosomal protein S18]-alanine N-acetyltransferase
LESRRRPRAISSQSCRIEQLRAGQAEDILRASFLLDEAPDPKAVRSYLRDRRNVFFMAYEGTTPVGFLRGTGLGQLTSERRQMFLYEIGVAEDHRRRGIGRALMHRLLEYARGHGFEEIFVFTDDPANRAAEALYRSTGGVTETVGDRMYVYRL